MVTLLKRKDADVTREHVTQGMWRRKGTLITAWKLYRLCVWFIFFLTGWQAPPPLPMIMTSLRKFRCLVLIATASEPTKLSSPCSSNVRNYFCSQYGIWRTPQISIPIFILHLWVTKSIIICMVDNGVFEKEYLNISFRTSIFCRLPDLYFIFLCAFQSNFRTQKKEDNVITVVPYLRAKTKNW